MSLAYDPSTAIAASDQLPPITVLIEWENAEDVAEFWVRRALVAFETELERHHNKFAVKPTVLYLFDRNTVKEQDIRDYVNKNAPKLAALADLRMEPTDGLTYYKLKNHGVRLANTDVVVMLDSDAAPQPGWLPNILAPLKDPEVMAVGGFTTLGYNNLVSRMMALSWIFNLPSERNETEQRRKIHANNCAFRTQFFRDNPWPDLPTFKKQCGFWIRDIEKRQIKWVRTADAMTIHAPQPGVLFLVWRAWTAGLDRDYQGAQTIGHERGTRLKFAWHFFTKKTKRARRRIFGKQRKEVGLPLWQAPFAFALAWGYYFILFVTQLWAALTRRYQPLPPTLQQATQH
jgi:hypothetical protein